MWNTIFVYGDHAYRGAARLAECEHVGPEDAERVTILGLPPRYIYRVESPEFSGLTSDPAQVSRWTHKYPDAEITVIPVM